MFFDKIALLCLSKDVLDIAHVAQWISDKEVELAARKHEKRSAYQEAAYVSETNMLLMLHILLEISQNKNNQSLSDNFRLRLHSLCHLDLSVEQYPFPVIRALRFYLVIGAKIIAMTNRQRILDNQSAQDAMFDAFDIFKLIIKFQGEFKNLKFDPSYQVPSAYFKSLMEGVGVMLTDAAPTSQCATYALTMCSTLTEKLFRLREYFVKEEQRENELISKKKVTDPLTLLARQKLRYHVIHVDAMLRNLNLNAYDSFRDKYTLQARTQIRESGADITCLTWLADKKNPRDLVAQVSEAYFDLMSVFELLYGTLKLVHDPVKISFPLLKQTLLQQLGHLHRKVNWLDLYRTHIDLYVDPALEVLRSTPSELLGGKEKEEYLTRHLKECQMRDYEELQMKDLQFLYWLTLGMTHLVDPHHREFNEDVVDFEAMLDRLTPRFLAHLFFGQMKSDSVSCIVTSLLNLKLKRALANAKTPVEREAIFFETKSDILGVLLLLEKRSIDLMHNNLIMTIQFTLDYFCMTLMECHEMKEALILTTLVVDTPILNLLNKYPNDYLYEFTYSYLLWLKNSDIDYRSVDVSHIGTMQDEHLRTLFTLAILALENINKPVVRVNTVVKNFFLTHAKFVLEYFQLLGTPDEAQVAEAHLKKISDYLLHQEMRGEEALERFASNKLVYSPTKLTTKKETTDSFLEGTVAKKDKKTKNQPAAKQSTKAKQSSKANVTQVKYVTIESTLKQLIDSHGSVSKVVDYCKKHFGRRYSTREKGYALVRLAECLAKLQETPSKQKQILNEIERVDEKAILALCESELSRDVFTDINERFTVAMAPWRRAEKPKDVVVKKQVSAPAPVPKQQPVVKAGLFKPATAKIKAPTVSKTPQEPRRSPSPKIEAPSVVENKSPTPVPVMNPWKAPVLVRPISPTRLNADAKPFYIENVYGDMLGDMTLNIKRNAIQQRVIQLLHLNGMEPYCHGGRVIYAAMLHNDVVIKPEPDLDIGCFPLGQQSLFQCISTHHQALGINDPAKDIWHDAKNAVYIITFNSKADNGEFEKLEIAYIPVATKAEIPTKLKEKSLEYGTNATGYCRAVDMRILYPSAQHRLFVKERILDVAWDEDDLVTHHKKSLDIKTYLREHPERQLDIVDRVAKLGHYGCALNITSRVLDAIISNHDALKNYLTSFTKIDKLFLQGYARGTFTIMHALKMMTALFPMLEREHVPVFYQACAMIDNEVDAFRTRPSSQDMKELRSKFFATALYESFKSQCKLSVSPDQSYQLHLECMRFLKLTRVYVSHVYLNFETIQKLWLETNKISHAEAVRLGAVNDVAETIPDAMKCLFTDLPFENPVFCTLDFRTYEEAKIRQWLEDHQTSPFNRNRLQPWQTIDDVLRPNIAVRDAVEEYRARQVSPQVLALKKFN